MDPKLQTLLTALHAALGEYLGLRPPAPEPPRVGVAATLDAVIAAVAAAFALAPADITRKFGPNAKTGDARRVALALCVRYHRGTKSQISARFNLKDGHSWDNSHRRLHGLVDIDPVLRNLYQSLQAQLDQQFAFHSAPAMPNLRPSKS